MLTRSRIRLAVQADIPAIQQLLDANDLLIKGLDWSEIDNSWWVAEYKDKLVGCMQVLPGKPLGAFTFLAVAPEYHGSGVGVQLLTTAEIVLGMQGCDGFVSWTFNPVILKRLERWNTSNLGEVSLLVKRVRKHKHANTLQNHN